MASQAEQAREEASPWIERLARIGYIAKAIVYAAIGLLALQVASRSGGTLTDKEGALRQIMQQPFGELVMVVVVIGFAGYGLWQLFARGIMDAENAGTDAEGLFKRARYSGAGIVYLALAVTAVGILFGSGGGGGGGSTSSEAWTARIMSFPFGRWLVGIAGAAVIGAAVYQVYLALAEKFLDKFNLDEMNEDERKTVIYSGKIGIIARAVVLGIVGWFLVQAAWQYDPQEVGGLGEALRTLLTQPFGPYLLGAVALGLIAYALYAFVQARYREIHT